MPSEPFGAERAAAPDEEEHGQRGGQKRCGELETATPERAEAIERAIELGLLEDTNYSTRA